MTSKELIAALQKEDPEGNLEVCVENKDIYFVEYKQAYWDGRLQRLIHDPDLKNKGYSIIGGKVTSRGMKLELHVMGIEDIIMDNPDVPIDLSELEERDRQEWEKCIAEWRQEVKDIIKEVNDKYEKAEWVIQDLRDRRNSNDL